LSRAFTPVEALTARHVVEGFDCGSPAQSNWLLKHGLEAHRSGRARVYVTRGLDESEQRVLGYYALASASVRLSTSTIAAHDADHVPVIVLARLGVDLSAEPDGLSRALAIDALRRIAVAGPDFGVRAVLIHCEDDAAREFYRGLADFPDSRTDRMHLLVPMNTLQRALES
jgi:hypothetical protein